MQGVARVVGLAVPGPGGEPVPYRWAGLEEHDGGRSPGAAQAALGIVANGLVGRCASRSAGSS